MTLTGDPVQLFSDRSDSYVRFLRLVRYPQGIRAYFLGSRLLRSDLRILDAGCGTGVVAVAIRDALLRRGLAPGSIHAFDLTPAMIERFRDTLGRSEIEGVDVIQGDVLQLHDLPGFWKDYDLIVSASMLEYLPPTRLSEALAGLRSLLRKGGSLVLFITRRNCITRPLVGRWWKANLYGARALAQSFREAGFAHITFCRFPRRFLYLGVWGYIIEADGGPRALSSAAH